MNGSSPHPDERMLQLLADRATEGLGRLDSSTLDDWLATHPNVDASAFERVAAMIALTTTPTATGALPISLKGRILADARAFFARNREG